MAALSGGTRVPAPRPICLRLGRKIRYSTRFIPLAPVGVKGKLTRLRRARERFTCAAPQLSGLLGAAGDVPRAGKARREPLQKI